MAEDSIAGGRLLGTAKVQEGIDEVGKQLKALAEQIKGLAALTKTSVVGGSVASGSVPMSYGHANGGGGTFGGAQFPGAGAPSPFTAGLATGNPSSAFPQAQQAAPGTPNGGGGSFAGSMPGRAMAGGAASFAALANYGNRIMPDQVGFNYVERYASRGASMEGSLTKELFSNQFYGQSTADRQQGVMNYVSQSGNAIGTRQATTQLGQLGAMSVANPTMPYADLIKGQMAATSTRGYYGLAQWGVNTLGANGRTMGPTSIGKQLSRTMGINPNASWNNKQINATFDDQNSAVNSNFRMLVGTGAMTQETADMQMADMRSRAVASSNGMSGSVYQQTMKAYLNNDAGTEAHDNAQAALREAGVTDTSMQTMQHQEGAQQNRTVNQTDAFASGLEDASDAVAKFSQAITDFLEKTGLDKALGYGSGASSVLAGAAGGTLGALGGIASSLGGGAVAKAAMSRLGIGGVATAARTGGAALMGGVSVAGAGTAALVAGSVATAGKSLSNVPSILGTKEVSDGLGEMYGSFYESATPAQKKYLDAHREEVVAAMSSDISKANNDSVWDTVTGKSYHDESQVVWEALQAGMPGTGGGGPDTAGRTSGRSKGHRSGKPQVSGDAIVKFALTFVGKVPYVWGGTTPNGWDCSGFCLYVFNHFGVSLPRLAGDQARGGKPVKKGDIRPGDLLFFELGSQSASNNDANRADHVGIAIGGGKMVNAANTTDDTCVMPIWETFTHARRYVGAGSGSYDGKNGRKDEEETDPANGASGSSGALGAESEAAAVAAAMGASAGAGGLASSSTSTSRKGGGGGGGSGPSAAALKGNQLLSTLSKAGFSGSNLRTAWAVAMAESGGRPTAHAQDSDDNSYGLFQINMLGSLGPARREQWNLKSNNELFDPDLNAKIAFQMSQGGKNWSPWGAYTSGAYKDFYNKVPGYAKGAWEISGDQTATVHDGEMIIPRDQAETIRSVLMRENVGGLNGGRGGTAGSGVYLVFQPGSIKFSGTPGTGSDAKRFAKQFVDAVTDDHRVKDLQKGR